MFIALVVIAALIALVLVVAATKPDIFRVERSTVIHAEPERVVALIEDFRKWVDWSPWEKLDLDMVHTYSGPPTGVGAVYEWHGNKKVGKGKMELMHVDPASLIRIKLDFFEPFEAHNTTEITFRQADGVTHVTWAMFGPAKFIMKVMHVFMNMDKMVGKDFETGLANLKTLAEKSPAA